jgi:TolA-binding protein
MNTPIKIGLYIFFTIGALVSASLFYSNYKSLDRNPEDSEVSGLPTGKSTKQSLQKSTPTNSLAPSSNRTTTNVISTVTNGVAGQTNQTNAVETSPEEKPSNDADIDRALGAGTGRGKNFAPLIKYMGAFFLMVIGLGLLAARDVSSFMASRALKVLYNDDGEGLKTPEYEQAEQVWADGNHLEAIRMMRDYLKSNPREQHVALRIAEIYEKDLQNLLAAALEYEEVLKHKLTPDRWSWAAIHLCNLYFKLDQEPKAVALLRRIAAEYGQTPAAEKARKRLSQLAAEGAIPIEEEKIPQSPPEPDKPASNLPPGFGPRKG